MDKKGKAGASRKLRKEQIKNAAIKLFSEKGFHNTSMQDIASAAGLGKGTLYWYWESKEELAFSLVSDMLSAFLGLIERTRDKDGSVIDRLRILARDISELYELEKDYCRLLLKFRADRHYTFRSDYIDKVMIHYNRMRSAISDLLRQGVESGEFVDIDREHFAIVILGMVEGLELEWLENEDTFSMQRGLDTILDLLVKGLGKEC